MSIKVQKKSKRNPKKFISRLKYKEIKKKLIDKDITQAQIARELGISTVWLWMVLSGRRKSERVYEYLREKVGVKI